MVEEFLISYGSMFYILAPKTDTCIDVSVKVLHDAFGTFYLLFGTTG